MSPCLGNERFQQHQIFLWYHIVLNGALNHGFDILIKVGKPIIVIIFTLRCSSHWVGGGEMPYYRSACVRHLAE